jgi:hypothetical protein
MQPLRESDEELQMLLEVAEKFENAKRLTFELS